MKIKIKNLNFEFQVNKKFKNYWLISNRGDLGDAIVYAEKTKRFYYIEYAYNNRIKAGEPMEIEPLIALAWMDMTDCAMCHYWQAIDETLKDLQERIGVHLYTYRRYTNWKNLKNWEKY